MLPIARKTAVPLTLGRGRLVQTMRYSACTPSLQAPQPWAAAHRWVGRLAPLPRCLPHHPGGALRGTARLQASASRAAGASMSPPAPQLLQGCLRAHGIEDVAVFAEPRFAKYWTATYVHTNLEPKLRALEAEGLGPAEILPLLLNSHNTVSQLITCELTAFEANLRDLRALFRGFQLPPAHLRRTNKAAAAERLSVVGQLMARGTGTRNTSYLGSSAGSLPKMQAWLAEHLGLTDGQVAAMVWNQPTLLMRRLGPGLLGVLSELDGLAPSEPGLGKRLMLKCPTIAVTTVETVRANVGTLRGLGCSEGEVLRLLLKRPDLVGKRLDGPVFQQKLAWMREEAGWDLDLLFDHPSYLSASLQRLASRLAFAREFGLGYLDNPGLLACATDAAFCGAVSRRLRGRFPAWAEWQERAAAVEGWQLRQVLPLNWEQGEWELSVEEWQGWVRGIWLPSPAGQRWGVAPPQQQRGSKPKRAGKEEAAGSVQL